MNSVKLQVTNYLAPRDYQVGIIYDQANSNSWVMLKHVESLRFHGYQTLLSQLHIFSHMLLVRTVARPSSFFCAN